MNRTFFDEKMLDYCQGVQGENILPAINGIVPENIREALWSKVVEHYKITPQFDTGIKKIHNIRRNRTEINQIFGLQRLFGKFTDSDCRTDE